MSDKKIKVVLVRPGEIAEITEIDNSLKAMQEAVGGYIELYKPFDDETIIVCNEEGKINGMPMNRAIFAYNGSIREIIFGTFFICYAPPESENFESLPDELAEEYVQVFKTPESFIRTENGVTVIPAE